jgi:hypothetical protein
MHPFDRTTTQHDLATLRTLLNDFFAGVDDAAWGNHTGARDKDWTLHETLAHVAAIAEAFNVAVFAGRRGIAVELGDVERRTDLRDWNERQIRARMDKTPSALIAELNEQFQQAMDYIDLLTDDELTAMVAFPIYNRPAPLSNFIEWQLSHAGVVHAAQLPRGLHQRPLWTHYPPDFAHRMANRFMLHFSWAYWHTLAPELHAVMHFHVDGDGGGDWTLVAAPDGGDVAVGAPDAPTYTLTFQDVGTLFGAFTYDVTLPEALRDRRLVVSGGRPREAFDVLKLFAPTPPRG